MSSESLFCCIRKETVAALPEEYVRQRLLQHMLEDKGFPPALIAVEKSLRHLPHLSVIDRRHVPDRRADIICFSQGLTNGSHALHPLVTVECKAVKLTPKVISQVVGYNHFVKASFIVVVNQTELRTGWYDQQTKEYAFVNYLPSYEELTRSIVRNS